MPLGDKIIFLCRDRSVTSVSRRCLITLVHHRLNSGCRSVLALQGQERGGRRRRLFCSTTKRYTNNDTEARTTSITESVERTIERRRGAASTFRKATAAAAASVPLLLALRQQQRMPFSKSASLLASLSLLSTTTVSSVIPTSSSHVVAAFSASMTTTTTTTSSTARRSNRHPLSPLKENFDHTWIKQLSPEDETNYRKSLSFTSSSINNNDLTAIKENHAMRPIFNGHYVPVKPIPLKNPRLVIHSPDMAHQLGLSREDVDTEEFVKFFSGDVDSAFHQYNHHHHYSDNEDMEGDLDDTQTSDQEGTLLKSTTQMTTPTQTWATPYALSIMGTRYKSNCPYGTGDGYGDGRAISIGEVRTTSTTQTSPSTNNDNGESRYELQLKGAGRTPFCRGADGRAVLRSSVREFLASEAMHNLNIPTTRALSLIVSDGPEGDVILRPWYSDRNSKPPLPALDDPRLAKYTLSQRKQILATLSAQQKTEPDVMIAEPCAITCRVARSFVRIGHIDLFSRRAVSYTIKDDDDDNNSNNEGSSYDTNTVAWREYEQMIWHACFREYYKSAYEPFRSKNDIASAARVLLEESCINIASLVAQWIRVGFAQGNFNADNCLVGGVTMDYGPFGFMDEYNPLFAKWTGSGEHFGFLNQPSAGYANYAILVDSVLPVIYPQGRDAKQKRMELEETLLENARTVFQEKVDEIFRIKMGFHPTDESADELWQELEPLMREFRTDWTLFWRQLTEVAKQFPIMDAVDKEGISDDKKTATFHEDMLTVLMGDEETRPGSSPFYERLTTEEKQKFQSWIQHWREALLESYAQDGPSRKAAMSEDTSFVPPEERMRLANPKYILRENMLVEAYTKAMEDKDESMIHDLFALIQNPYDEGTNEQHERYYKRAPDEALKAGGTAYMT